MSIIEVIIEATDPIGVNTAVGNHIEDPYTGEGDNKTITGANTKATADNLTPPVEDIIIITMAIIEAEVVVAIVETISDPMVMAEAIIKAIIITKYHQYYTHDDGSQVEQYGPPCVLCSGFDHSPKHCFKGEHDFNNFMEKMSLGSSNQHQNGLYQ